MLQLTCLAFIPVLYPQPSLLWYFQLMFLLFYFWKLVAFYCTWKVQAESQRELPSVGSFPKCLQLQGWTGSKSGGGAWSRCLAWMAELGCVSHHPQHLGVCISWKPSRGWDPGPPSAVCLGVLTIHRMSASTWLPSSVAGKNSVSHIPLNGIGVVYIYYTLPYYYCVLQSICMFINFLNSLGGDPIIYSPAFVTVLCKYKYATVHIFCKIDLAYPDFEISGLHGRCVFASYHLVSIHWVLFFFFCIMTSNAWEWSLFCRINDSSFL